MRDIKSLIAIDGNNGLLWNSANGHLEAGEGANRQILLLTSRPYFTVTDIKISPLRNLLCLSGTNGVTIVELPRKLGGSYKSDRDKQIYCKTFNLDERLFSCEKRLKILHVAWHPYGTETRQELCILTNDNRLRFYHAKNDLELQVINLRMSNSFEEDELTREMSMMNLGENGICFDFGPPTVVQEPEVLWPIYILMGNGEIYLIYTSYHNPTYAEHIIGPLTMLPQAEDSYGSDACSLIVLNSSPPLLAIATPSGTIYHCFAIFNDDGMFATQTLYVYEAVELSKDLIKNPDDPYSPHPMKLFKDPTSDIRYFCVHQNGVHTVVLPVLESLQSGCDIIEDKESFSEFLICTRTTTPSNANESCDEISTPQGLGIETRETSIVLLVLMHEGKLLVHRISPATTLINRKRFPRSSLDASRDSNDQEILNISQIDASRANFEEQIQLVLKRKSNVPMLKLSQDLEKDNQVSEVVDRAIATFQSEYIKKYKLAIEAMKKKLTILEKDMKNQQVEYQRLVKEKEEIYISVKAISGKSEAACAKQKQLMTRIDKILSATAHSGSDCNEAETKLRRELKSLKDQLSFYRDQLDSSINKHKFHMNQKNPIRLNGDELLLSPAQINHVKDTLSRQSADISELKRIVKSRQNKLVN